MILSLRSCFSLCAQASASRRLESFSRNICSLNTNKRNVMRVAVVGCAHGELDLMYDAVEEARKVSGPIDLVLCPGDFQAVRNQNDLACMACPDKYKDMRSFWRYYSGEAKVPVPTVFVGGNHEASNHLQEIPYGGLVAPGIYFIGNAGVINVKGLRIAGISGVYTAHNYKKQRVERPPYQGNQIKSVYHTRYEDYKRLRRLSREVDIMLSHDWPRNIEKNGDEGALLRHKPFLKSEIRNGSFGNPATQDLLSHLQPRFWFAAHMHVKFPALIQHSSGKVTRFLALDKILPRRDFLQVLEVPVCDSSSQVQFPEYLQFKSEKELVIGLDPEWLTILKTEAEDPEREAPVTDSEIEAVIAGIKRNCLKPYFRSVADFSQTAAVYKNNGAAKGRQPSMFEFQRHTLDLASALGLKLDIGDTPVPDSAAKLQGNAANSVIRLSNSVGDLHEKGELVPNSKRLKLNLEQGTEG